MTNKFQTPKILLELIPAFLAFLMPVFFLPITTEFFEFNKLALLLVMTTVSILLWAVKMLMDRKVQITRSALDVPLMLMLLVVVLSAVFSIDKVVSIYGQQNRWYPSLVGFLTLVLFYYTVATNIKTVKAIKTTLLGLITGITINSIVTTLSYFGIYLGNARYLQIPNFTLTGSPTTSVMMAVVATVIAINFLISNQKLPVKMGLTFVSLVNILVVAIVGGLTGWIVLLAGLLIVVYTSPANAIKANKIQMGIMAGFTIALVIVSILPATRSVFIRSDYPAELKTPLRESWVVISNTVRDFPALGSGPSTYSIDFARYKPLTINNTDYWNIRFDKAYSEPFAILASFGLIGAAVFAFLGFKTFKIAMKVRDNNDVTGTSNAVSGALLTMFVVYLFTFSTVLNTFVFVLLVALAVAKLAINEEETMAESVIVSLYSFKAIQNMSIVGALNPQKREILQYILLLPMVALVVVAYVFTYKIYLAEYYMRKSIVFAQENNGSLSYNYQTRAINTYPRRAFYHNAYAQTNIALANSVATTKEQLTQEETQIIQQLIGQAIRSARISTEAISPLDVNSWITRGDIYRALIGIATDADTWAINSYNTAIQLEPINPQLRINLGGIYYLTGDYLSAASQYRTATSLKPDYANAHYNLAQALLQLNAPVDALRELTATRDLVPYNSEDYQRVVQEMNELSKKISESSTSDANKPSVAQIEQGVTPEEQPTKQEPLVTPEEKVQQDTKSNVKVDENVELEPAVQPKQ